MNDTVRLTHQTLVRCRETFAQNLSDFSAGGAAHQLYADLQATITDIEQKADAYGTGRSEAKHGTRTINTTREELLADMFAIRETSKVMEVEDKFPYPPRTSDEDLLQLAGVYATNALPLKAQFIAHELTSDFLEDLAADKAAFQTALADRSNAVGDHNHRAQMPTDQWKIIFHFPIAICHLTFTHPTDSALTRAPRPATS